MNWTLGGTKILFLNCIFAKYTFHSIKDFSNIWTVLVYETEDKMYYNDIEFESVFAVAKLA